MLDSTGFTVGVFCPDDDLGVVEVGVAVTLFEGVEADACGIDCTGAGLEAVDDALLSSVFSFLGCAGPPSFSSRRLLICKAQSVLPTYSQLAGLCTCSIFSASGASGTSFGGGGSTSMIANRIYEDGEDWSWRGRWY